MSSHLLSRRAMLRLGAGLGAGTALALAQGRFARRSFAQSQPARRYLFVVTATGGASIVDSFLPVAVSQVSSPERAAALVAYPDDAIAQPSGSNIRCVRNLSGGIGADPLRWDYDVADFVARHHQDMLVTTVRNTSVNHAVAQKRAVTGADIDRGRTMMEAVAAAYGQDQLLPNCNLSSGGYVEPGIDTSVPDYARAQIINEPRLFALTTHGSRGVSGAPEAADIEHARAIRAQLEGVSPFAKRFSDSELRRHLLDVRNRLGPALESSDLITKLMLLQASPEQPLEAVGLRESPDMALLLEHFPDLAHDRLQAQAAIAFLLARYDISSTVTFGPGFLPDFYPDGSVGGTPLSFDYSHSNHVLTQNLMWGRLMQVVDGLIRLLQQQPYGGDPEADSSMWEHSLIYVATDFGRTKTRPAGGDFTEFSSGHDFTNGNVLLSPLLRGNRVFGGVDPETCLTYGFDPGSGAPDPGRSMSEGHLYSLVTQALGLEFAGAHDMSALLR
ncbi:hypothetical protein [Haliangium ochraceum]|uniref:DUF1552 domain-containing protein n=1 Tax=Haliangium ochraceum (strain DSM 14365 / JCM 11303 / SMP-2) TaxID=502025 RepID=D0LWR5_HALO1|nr:hypothetical protein [Haliangium ochraceum]ACY14162.1 hypothetical protein Hoch_1612 [Haliangium ochraceum DSM 14365]